MRLFNRRYAPTTFAVALCALLVMPATNALGQECYNNTWEWMNPSPTAENLNGVWAATDSDVFAVGDVGTIIRWNGSAWQRMDSPTSKDLSAVWGSSPTNVYAVGAQGVIVRYDGSTWNLTSSGRNGPLADVGGVVGGPVYAAGGAGVYRNDGSGWQLFAWDEAAEYTSLSSIWVNSESDIYVVGGTNKYLGSPLEPIVGRYDGSEWVWESPPTFFRDIWAASPTDAYAVTRGYPFPPHLYRFDGSSWTEFRVNIHGRVIHGISANDIFVVTESGMSHWNGSAWTDASGPDLGPNCAMWPAEGSGVYTVGMVGKAYSYEDQTFTPMGYRRIGDQFESFTDVWATEAGDVFVISGDGNLFTYHEGDWRKNHVADQGFIGVWAQRPYDVWAVTGDGEALHFNGRVDARFKLAHRLEDIWGRAPDDIYAAGTEVIPGTGTLGRLYHYDGTSWNLVWDWGIGPHPTQLWGTSTELFVLLGHAGTSVARFDLSGGHTRWILNEYTTPRGIWGSSGSDVYAVENRIWHFDGSSWQSATHEYGYDRIWGRSSTDVWLGHTVHYDGVSWQTVGKPLTDNNLHGVSGSGCDLFLVGALGTILRLPGDQKVPVFITSFDARPIGDAIELWWSIRSDETVRGFRIDRRDLGSDDRAVIDDPALHEAGMTHYTDRSITPGATYEYRLVVVETDGGEVTSQPVTVSTSPLALELLPNYPNPFNPATWIRFSLPHRAHVVIGVYDAAGRNIATLVNQTHEPGPHKILWDVTAAGLTSGVYWLRMGAGDRVLTRKLTLLK